MRKLFFLLIGITFLFSCNNESTKGKTKSKKETINKNESIKATDTLRKDAKFNGEYLKIPAKDSEKDRKMTLGSDYFSMGKVKFTIGADKFAIDLFYKKGTVLTFSQNYVNTYIQSSSGKKIHLHLNTTSTKAKGTYRGKVSSKAKQTATLTLSYQKKKYTLISGKVTVVSFLPKDSKLHVTVDGQVKDNTGKIQSIKGVLNVNYGEAIQMPSSIS